MAESFLAAERGGVSFDGGVIYGGGVSFGSDGGGCLTFNIQRENGFAKSFRYL